MAAGRAAGRGRPRLDEQVRTLLVVLDQFEDYFLYHRDEDGEGTFDGEFPQIVNEPNLRVNFLLSIREDAWAKLDRFEGRSRGCSRTTSGSSTSTARRRGRRSKAIVEWNRRLPPGGRSPTRSSRSSSTRSSRRLAAGTRAWPRGERRRPVRATEAAGRGAVPAARDGAALARDGRGRCASSTLAAGAARRGAADRRDAPRRRARALTARRAGGRGRRSSATSSRARRRRSRTPASDLAEWTEAARAGGLGGAREALPRRERAHPASISAPPGGETEDTLRALPRRPRPERGAPPPPPPPPPPRQSLRAQGASIPSRASCSPRKRRTRAPRRRPASRSAGPSSAGRSRPCSSRGGGPYGSISVRRPLRRDRRKGRSSRRADRRWDSENAGSAKARHLGPVQPRRTIRRRRDRRRQVRLWRVAGWRELASRARVRPYLQARAAFSDDGRFLVAGGYPGWGNRVQLR